jgi:hypothetical protein
MSTLSPFIEQAKPEVKIDLSKIELEAPFAKSKEEYSDLEFDPVSPPRKSLQSPKQA